MTQARKGETMTTTKRVGDRTLVDGYCFGCGTHVEQWVKDGGMLLCQDCRDKMSREDNGWTPENSQD